MERGIVIETRLDLRPELPQMLGIESEIREALTNLVFNAVDAMPKGGTLSIRTSTVGDGGAGPPEAFTLEVTDTGTGMDEETRRRCLEPFFSTKGERGTGLGLAMVFGVMQRHEGEVEIESQPGRGTTVRLRFPTETRPEEPAPPPVEAAPLNATLRILVIDDEPLVRDLVRDMLRVDGHQVELADDGGAGLKAFREALGTERPFDVVMTDLGMPYVDGREVARTVKQESPRTPVVLLTGWGTRLHAEGDIPEEIDVILNKPPRMAPLRQALEKVHAAREPGPGRREAG
jgi:CheY-like chemotaxis protein